MPAPNYSLFLIISLWVCFPFLYRNTGKKVWGNTESAANEAEKSLVSSLCTSLLMVNTLLCPCSDRLPKKWLEGSAKFHLFILSNSAGAWTHSPRSFTSVCLSQLYHWLHFLLIVHSSKNKAYKGNCRTSGVSWSCCGCEFCENNTGPGKLFRWTFSVRWYLVAESTPSLRSLRLRFFHKLHAFLLISKVCPPAWGHSEEILSTRCRLKYQTGSTPKKKRWCQRAGKLSF